MLRASYTPMLSDQDQLIFETLVPPNHYLPQLSHLQPIRSRLNALTLWRFARQPPTCRTKNAC